MGWIISPLPSFVLYRLVSNLDIDCTCPLPECRWGACTGWRYCGTDDRQNIGIRLPPRYGLAGGESRDGDGGESGGDVLSVRDVIPWNHDLTGYPLSGSMIASG